MHGWIIYDLTSYPARFSWGSLYESLVLGGEWTELKTKFRQIIEHWLTLSELVVDLRYVAPFQNAGDSNGTGVENLGQILHFLIPEKIRGGVVECPGQYFKFSLARAFWMFWSNV